MAPLPIDLTGLLAIAAGLGWASGIRLMFAHPWLWLALLALFVTVLVWLLPKLLRLLGFVAGRRANLSG